MKIYLDFICIINFFFDFILLYGTSKIEKHKISIKRLLLGSLVGSLSMILLFLKLTTFSLIIFKIIISIMIILVTFGRKDFENNIFYFYVLSIILGGGIYLLKDNFEYKNIGLIFIKNDYYLNFFVIMIISPIIIYFYIKDYLNNKIKIDNKYSIEIYINNEILSLEALLDTGNNLKDPYKNRPIVLLDKNIKIDENKVIYVPYKALNTEGIIPCIKPDKIIINNKIFTDCLIGLSKDKFSLNGVNCILPNKFKEDLC